MFVGSGVDKGSKHDEFDFVFWILFCNMNYLYISLEMSPDNNGWVLHSR